MLKEYETRTKEKGALATNDEDRKALAFAEQMVNRLGIRPTFNGRKYLVHAVLYGIKDPAVLDVLTKELYPKVARQHATSAQCVERSIRHAIAQAWGSPNGIADSWCEIFAPFGAFSPDMRPTTGEVITMLTMLYRNAQG